MYIAGGEHHNHVKIHVSISSWIINLDMNSKESACFFCIVLQA